MIGLGVMGRNLLLNMADHGFSVIGFDKDPAKGSTLEASAGKDTVVKGVSTLKEMIQLLDIPRKIMVLVPAGDPVDHVIEDLLPLLSKDDIIIDGGNSHYVNTLRRVTYCAGKGLHFMGVGVSGGEQGARTGPSIMPGGDPAAYPFVQPLFEAVAAKVNGEPCVAYLGKHAAGHYVKMVHNGIEYAIMQLISECYDLLHRGLGLTNDELYEVFVEWDKSDLQSYLIKITADIFLYEDDKTTNRLVDMILDKAGSKGTGKWTSQEAIDLPVPIPTIDMAVTLRNISSFKEQRTAAAKLYKHELKKTTTAKNIFITQVHDALYFSILLSYAQGMAMLQKASSVLDMQIPLLQVVKIWRGGCIIRSSMLATFTEAFEHNPSLPNLLLDSKVAQLVLSKESDIRAVVAISARAGYPSSAIMSALGYFDSYRSEKLPTNLIQAQRDYFGAHTYQRIDSEGSFHTEWNH